MMTDPIADMLTRIRNAVRVERATVDVPVSKVKRGVAEVLKREGFIWDWREVEAQPVPHLQLELKYGPNGERLIRHIKRAFQDSGISLPDEAREVTFPHGVPVRIIEGEGAAEPAAPVRAKPAAEPETVATKAEAGLQSESKEIKEQARRSWTPGENLLTPSSSADTS
jgi:ribosomal protein S8